MMTMKPRVPIGAARASWRATKSCAKKVTLLKLSKCMSMSGRTWYASSTRSSPPSRESCINLSNGVSAFATVARRFGDEHGVVPMATELGVALEARGVKLSIVNMMGGGDIDQAVINGIEACDTFLVFGSAKYGEDTGNQACTYYEYKHAFAKKKRIILLRMIPFDQEFENLQARVIFNANRLHVVHPTAGERRRLSAEQVEAETGERQLRERMEVVEEGRLVSRVLHSMAGSVRSVQTARYPLHSTWRLSLQRLRCIWEWRVM